MKHPLKLKLAFEWEDGSICLEAAGTGDFISDMNKLIDKVSVTLNQLTVDEEAKGRL